MERDINSIVSYRQTITELAQDLIRLETYADKLDMDHCKQTLRQLNERIKEDRFNLAVLGEFRRGKSTLINALLRTPVLPSDIVPCTASVNRITYDPQPRAKVEYIDGRTKEIPIDDLAQYATQEGDKSTDVREITVWYPTVYCSNNVDIYDTPGLNDSDEMTKATNEVISRMDVALFVLSANVNFSLSECDFISNRLLTSEVGRVIFVVTRMDEYNQAQQEKILRSIRARIEEMVLPKAQEVLSDDPEKLALFKSKLGEIQIYGVSSTMALKARADHDAMMLEQSGFMAFERAIDKLLTQERGRVTLDKQTGRILKSSSDIYHIIQARLAPLTVTEDQFREKCDKAEGEINEIRKTVRQETERLDQAETRIVEEIGEEWDDYVAQIKESIRQEAQCIEISPEDLKTKNREALLASVWSERMSPMVSRQIQVYSEKIADRVTQAASHECQLMDAYAQKVAEHMNNIQTNFQLSDEEHTTAENIGKVALESFVLSGLGGVLTGYKTAGVKGALVGGLSGAAITSGTAYAAGFALAALGIVSAPAVIVGGALAGLTGLIGGRTVVKRVFWKERAGELRDKITQAGCEALDEALQQENIKDSLLDYVRNTFAALKKQVSDNTEGTLADLSKTLQKTRENFAAEKAQAEQTAKDYAAILESLSSISAHAQEVRQVYRLDA